MSCPPGEHSHYSFSYEPLTAEQPEEAELENAVPSQGPHETDVWLTEWQVSEDGFSVALDEEVDWELVPMDQEWLHRMFAGRRLVTLQRDTYAGFVGEIYDRSEWTHLSGQVTRIDQVSVRYPVDNRTGLAEVGSAMHHTVSSVQERRTHDGRLVGWVVRIRDST
ncbi:DUF6578 domain-containing protein [Arthrobacter sp. HLT1-21]